MKRTFETRVVVVVAVAAALLAGAITFFFLQGARDEDRGTIIVRGGSVVFEHQKTWRHESASDKAKARPNHSGGHHVTGFSVKFKNPADLEQDDNVSACPKIAMLGSKVEIEYADSSTEKLTIGLVAANPSGTKQEPIVIAPGNMDIDAGTQKQLSYGTAAQGSIAKVTITDASSSSLACKPKSGKKFDEITVQPMR